MHLSTLVEMVESGMSDRTVVAGATRSLTGAELCDAARAAGTALAGKYGTVIYAGENAAELPIALFGAAWAGIPFSPVNYRVEDRQLLDLIERLDQPLVLADAATADRLVALGVEAQHLGAWVDALPRDVTPIDPPFDDDEIAIILYTSGTTSAPKQALLRHRHLMAYLLGTSEFASADEDEAVLIAVPPYHIAGMANLLSNLFVGRRIVYMERFDAATWLQLATGEGITHAMVVPTMLARIVESIDGGNAAPTQLRTLSYGGSKISPRVLERALDRFPTTGFVNAYGLTETASTIAVLGPDDHRLAFTSPDPAVRRRLSSAGRLLPTLEFQVRDDDGNVLEAGDIGILYVRGEQIAGEYATGSLLDADGWFCTRDRAAVDAEGYLFIEGRADDTIIRGGENIAPSEIEEVIRLHPAVADVCVVGLPDDEWGQRLCAVVVLEAGQEATPEELRAFSYERLRGSKTPEQFLVHESLPYTPTGKLLRRVVLDELTS